MMTVRWGIGAAAPIFWDAFCCGKLIGKESEILILVKVPL